MRQLVLTSLIILASLLRANSLTLPSDLLFFMQPQLTVPFGAGSLEPDGQIGADDEAGSCTTTQFLTLAAEARGDDRTRVFFRHNGEALYIGVRQRTGSGQPPRDSATERDDPALWTRNDCIELQIDAGGHDFNFIGNARGTMGDRKNGQSAWNDSRWSYRASTSADGWECEFLIPAATLGLSAFAPGQFLQLDVFNNNRSHLQAGLAYRAGRWHGRRTYWPRLQFGAPDMPFQQQCRTGTLAEKRIGFDLGIRNPAATPRRIRVWAAFCRARPDQAENYFSQISGLYNDQGVAVKPGATHNELMHHILTPLLRDRYLAAAEESYDTTIEPAGSHRLALRKPALPGHYLLASSIRCLDTDAVIAAWTHPYVLAPPLQTRLDYYYTTAQVVVAQVQMPSDVPPESLRVRISNAAGILEEKVVPGGKPGETVPVALSSARLQPGRYLCSIEGLRQGQVEQTFSLDFDKPEDPDWLNSDAGRQLDLPPPWTAVEAEADRCSVWGREILWQESFLPARIRSQGSELLAAPLQLRAVRAGRDIAWTVQRHTLLEQQRGLARYRLEAEAPQLRLQGTLLIEFDGMMRFDLQLDGPGSLDQLFFEVPVSAAVARYFKRDENLGLQPRLLVPKDWEERFPDWALLGGKSWSMPFTPALVLRNDRVGLEWFAEHDADWHNADEAAKLSIVSTPEAETLRVHLIDQPLAVTSSRRYTFGLMPWPVRPRPAQIPRISQYLSRLDGAARQGLRRIPAETTWLFDHTLHEQLGLDAGDILRQMRLGQQAGMEVLWVFHWNHYRDPQGRFYHPCEHIELFNEPMRQRVARLGDLAAQTGLRIIGHVGYGIAPTNHDFKYYALELASHPIDNKGSWGYKYSPAGCMPDLYAHRARAFARDYHWSGLQMDGTYMLRYDEGEYTGAAIRLPDGRLRGRYPVFALRELARRLYAVYHGEVSLPTPDGLGFVYVHTGGYSCGAVTSFADAIHCGEEPLSMDIRHLDELDFTREWVRYPSLALGPPFEFLPKMGSAPVGNLGRLAIALQLGMSMPAYHLLDHLERADYRRGSYPVHRLWSAWQWLDPPAGNTHFRRGSDIAPLLACDEADLLPALWLGEGKMLLALTNRARTPKPGTVTLQAGAAAHLRQGVWQAEDAIDGTPVPIDGNRLHLTVEADGYRLIKISALEARP